MARKILLADDSVTAQNMGRKILSDAGYEVITVNNGSAALKRISEQRPDLIVLDVYMPGYSGLEVCQRLKESQETSRMPVLLTVGKLEPFKPEEAKRVRADAFIVKPFEASELLSALSKLEDKVVPRAEPSKPGRFARAIAAVEADSRNAEAADEDTGWKNRISFPSKKKKKQVAEDESEEAAAYNPVNRDLRTVVAPPAAPLPEMPVTADPQQQDAPPLPKDVTPEELEALAAAVGQLQAKELAAAPAEQSGAPAASPETPAPAPADVAKPETVVEAKAEAAPPAQPPVETLAHRPVVTFGDRQAEEEYRAEVQREAAAEVKSWEKVGAGVEAKTQEAEEAKISEAKTPETKTDEMKLAETKISETKTEDQIGAPKIEETASVSQKRAAESGAPSPAERIAAIAALEPANGKTWDAASPSAEAKPRVQEDTGEEEDPPATMAAATAVGASSTSSRSHWTAVPVALDRDEAMISLEQEMEKAYAAMVAAETAAAVPVTPSLAEPATVAEAPSPEPAAPAAVDTPAAAAESVAVAPAMAEPVAVVVPESPIAAEPAPVAQHESVLAQALSAVAQAVKEAVGIGSPEPAATTEPPAPVAAEPAPAQEPETAKEIAAQSEAPAPQANEPAAVAVPETQAAEIPADTSPQPSRVEPVTEEKQQEENEDKAGAKPEPVAAETTVAPEATAEFRDREQDYQDNTLIVASSSHIAAALAEAFEGKAKESQSAAELAPPVAESSAVRSDSATGGVGDMAEKRESEAAAAWASWRQIRESSHQKPASKGSAKSKQQDEDEDEYPEPSPDRAAMAVAAGAEKAPEEAPAAPGPDAKSIASIVDSVLADLRPKIVEEIAKKLNEKK